VVIRDFDVVGIAVLPPETDPELVIDANTMLPSPIPFEAFEAIAGWDTQVP
jgi:hypothetical protein